jgi:acyl carrier protein
VHNVKEILAEVFTIDKDKIPNDVNIGDLPGWDSLGHMRLVLYIEKILKRPIETDEIIKIINSQNIKTILNRAS